MTAMIVRRVVMKATRKGFRRRKRVGVRTALGAPVTDKEERSGENEARSEKAA